MLLNTVLLVGLIGLTTYWIVGWLPEQSRPDSTDTDQRRGNRRGGRDRRTSTTESYYVLERRHLQRRAVSGRRVWNRNHGRVGEDAPTDW